MALWNSSIMQMIMGGGGKKATEGSSWNDWNDAVAEYDQATSQVPNLDAQLMQPQQQSLIQGPGLQMGKGGAGMMPMGYGQSGLQVGGSFQDYIKKIMSLIGR